MPAYMIFTREGPIVDEAAIAEYGGMNQSNAGQWVEQFAIKPLAVYGAQEVIEGSGPEGVVLLEFPDADKARAWYNSPEYQKAIPLRMKGAPYRCVLVEGL